ncbi:MAG: hypothetical protein JNG84_09885, partial [Archangium sp.]|nr:hypothetical protein [Archangium sp.]
MTALALLVVAAAPLVWTEQPVFEHHAGPSGWGTSEVSFVLPPEAHGLEVRFAQRLEGLRVEVDADAGRPAPLPLQPERRYGGTSITLEWKTAGLRRVRLRLHL